MNAHRAPGWWRRNRWGLVALPLAAVAALAGSSDRVKLLFWDEGLHREQAAQQGDWLEFRDTFHDSEGEHPLELRVRLDSVDDTTTGWGSSDPIDLQPGGKAVRVTVSFEADPDLAMRVCQLAVRDADGTRYAYLPVLGEVSQPLSPCVPDATPGPWPAMGEDLAETTPGEPPRPRSWTVEPVLVVPEDVEIADVVFWWEKPGYAALTVDPL